MNRNHKEEFPKIYFQVSQELSHRMRTHQEEDSQKDLAFFTRFGETILELIATDISVERLSGASEWIKALICEHEKTKSNKGSLILEMIQHEYQAAQKNEILLVRATNGLPLQSKALTKQEYKDQKRKDSTDYFIDCGIRSPELEEKVEKKVNEVVEKYYRVEWFQSFNPDQSVLDFPLKGGFNEHSAYEGIHDFNQSEGRQYDQSVSLSYATSLLAGYLYDGFNRAGRSACSFVYFIYYIQEPKLTLYTLSLDKKWFFTEGASFFHVSHSPLQGIIGEGEFFHPRLKAIAVPPNITSEDRDPYWWNCEKRISTHRFKLDDSFDWSGFNKRIKENDEEKKIFQYVFKANEILSSASILSLGGKLMSRDRFAAEEAKKMIENQKKCSEVLIEKCSEES